MSSRLSPEALDEKRERNREYMRLKRLDPEYRLKEKRSFALWYEKNKESDAATWKLWYAASGKAKRAKYMRAYQKANRDVIRDAVSNYRARRLDSLVEHVDRLILYERDDGICGICQKPVGLDFHVDHVVPLSRGGAHSYANTQIAHPSCNISKGARIM